VAAAVAPAGDGLSDEAPTSGDMAAQSGDVSTWHRNRERVDPFTFGTLVKQNGGTEGLDLHGANLADIDLSPEMIAKLAAETHLEHFIFWSFRKHASFRGAHLECASLWDAKLPQAEFYEAHLEGAKLSGAHLEGASLERAHLHRAKLDKAHLDQAVLRDAQLQGADMYLAELPGANLQRAQLHSSEPMWADLKGADLFGAGLERANLTGADLRGARLTNAHLDDASLMYAQLQGVDLSVVNSLDGVAWYGAFLDRTRMGRLQLREGIGDERKARVLNTGDAYQEAMEAIGAFATIGFNTLEPLGWGARLLTSVESALGVLLFALFVFTLGNRMSRS